MPKFFIEANQMQENKITLLGEDVNHIANVLKLFMPNRGNKQRFYNLQKTKSVTNKYRI